MPITLVDAKVGMADKVDQAVIDEFRRGSFLLDALVFDNAVSPGTAGSTLTYGYTKLKVPSTAAFREINTEYVNNESKREKATADLKIFGGEFNIDRVIANTSGAVNELSFQMSQKIKGAINLFHNTVINGDSATDDKSFDGLDVLLTGSVTEFNTTTAIDLSTSAALASNNQSFLDSFDEFVSLMDGAPTMFLMNTKMLTKMRSVARRAGYFSHVEDGFGRQVDAWNGIPMIDLKDFYDGAKSVPCVPIDSTTGETSIYAIQIDIEGFHGVSPLGDKVIATALPDLKAPGVIKKGDVEMVAAVVLKNSLKAGVFRKIKVK